MANKITFIRATGYAMVGGSGTPSTPLAPGERLPYNEDDPVHKSIAQEISSGVNTVLEIVDIDLEAEARAEEERKGLLEQAEKIAAEQREDQLRQQQAAAGAGTYDPTANSVRDVLSYLEGASPEEVERVQAVEADSQRNSKMIADFEPPRDGAGTTAGSEATSPGQDSPTSAKVAGG